MNSSQELIHGGTRTWAYALPGLRNDACFSLVWFSPGAFDYVKAVNSVNSDDRQKQRDCISGNEIGAPVFLAVQCN